MSGSLPDAGWRNAKGLQQIVVALQDEHGGPRFVGGAVRDTLLGLDVSDVDLATTLLPEQVIDRLEAARIKAVPTGLDHGTVTAVAGGKNYEITTLRRDVATDGRRAVVAFSTDWHEDAARRDFTINALYADPATGEIFDYFGGLDDLRCGTIRFIGNADQRIAEDYLRILRYFRFYARFGKAEPDAEALRACAAAASKMTALSRERIAQEMVKTISLPNPVHAIELMAELSIFAPFLPEIDDHGIGCLRELVARENEHRLAPSLQARLIALLPKDALLVNRIAARLKLSNRLREGLEMRLTADKPFPDHFRAIAYRTNIDCARDVAMLFANDDDLSKCLAKLSDWDLPVFPIKGGDLIARGLTAGPVVAKTLRAIEHRWITENFPAEARIVTLADQAVAEAMAFSKKA